MMDDDWAGDIMSRAGMGCVEKGRRGWMDGWIGQNKTNKQRAKGCGVLWGETLIRRPKPQVHTYHIIHTDTYTYVYSICIMYVARLMAKDQSTKS